MLGPDRDIGLYIPAIGTLHVIDALRCGPFGQEWYIHCSDTHEQ